MLGRPEKPQLQPRRRLAPPQDLVLARSDGKNLDRKQRQESMIGWQHPNRPKRHERLDCCRSSRRRLRSANPFLDNGTYHESRQERMKWWFLCVRITTNPADSSPSCVSLRRRRLSRQDRRPRFTSKPTGSQDYTGVAVTPRNDGENDGDTLLNPQTTTVARLPHAHHADTQ